MRFFGAGPSLTHMTMINVFEEATDEYEAEEEGPSTP